MITASDFEALRERLYSFSIALEKLEDTRSAPPTKDVVYGTAIKFDIPIWIAEWYIV